jgi:hypothetical protein
MSQIGEGGNMGTGDTWGTSAMTKDLKGGQGHFWPCFLYLLLWEIAFANILLPFPCL